MIILFITNYFKILKATFTPFFFDVLSYSCCYTSATNIYIYIYIYIYIKRKDFTFPITKYPNLNGNIPINPAYGVLISQLIWFCRINLLLQDFKNDVIKLAVIMLQQGFKYNILKIKFKQFARDNVVR